MSSQQIALDQPGPEIVPAPGEIMIRPQPVQPLRNTMVVRLAVKPESRPTRLLLGTVNDRGFRVIKAVPVDLEFRGDMVVASWSQIEEFGTGKSTSLACEDLGRTIAELYGSLEADQSHLGLDLADVWRTLQEYVARRV